MHGASMQSNSIQRFVSWKNCANLRFSLWNRRDTCVNIGKFLPRHPAIAKFWLGILKWFRGFFLLHQLLKKIPSGFFKTQYHPRPMSSKNERKVQEVSFPLCSWDILLWRRWWQLKHDILMVPMGRGGGGTQLIIARWWFQIHFLCSSRKLGKWSNFSSIFFPMGWFNHQLETGFSWVVMWKTEWRCDSQLDSRLYSTPRNRRNWYLLNVAHISKDIEPPFPRPIVLGIQPLVFRWY